MIPSFYRTDGDGTHYRPFKLVIPLSHAGFAALWDEFRMAEERRKSLALLCEDLEKDGIFERIPGKRLRECLFQEAVRRELAHINLGRKLLLGLGYLEDISTRKEPADFIYPTSKSFTVQNGKNPQRVGI